MSDTIYHINKGVGKPFEVKGVTGTYIYCCVIGLVLLLIVFAILYASGCNTYGLLLVILPAGAGLLYGYSRLSKRFGEHGLSKWFASKQIPKCLKCKTWKVFSLSGK